MNDPEIIEKLDEIKRELSEINWEIKKEFSAIRISVALIGGIHFDYRSGDSLD